MGELKPLFGLHRKKRRENLAGKEIKTEEKEKGEKNSTVRSVGGNKNEAVTKKSDLEEELTDLTNGGGENVLTSE